MPSFKGNDSSNSHQKKDGLPFAGKELDKQKRMIIFLLKIEIRMKGVMGYGMGTYDMEALQGA